MLSSNVQATPRPRPPAKVRRSPSLNFPPPPPYAPRSDVLLNSPIAVTAQLLGTVASEDIANSLPQVVEEWMNEKSKEELSDLLLKADGLIKERETGNDLYTHVHAYDQRFPQSSVLRLRS